MELPAYIDHFLRDFRYSVRMSTRPLGLSVLIILTLGLGIGVNVAIFSIANSLVLKPLPVRNPHELVVLASREKGSAGMSQLSYPDFLDCSEPSKVFSGMLAYDVELEAFAADNRADRVVVSYVTGNYFSVLEVHPALGRLFRPDEGNQPGDAPLSVLGYSFWKRRFGANGDIVGKKVTVHGRPVTVIGVTPREFHGVYSLMETDVYVPLSEKAIQDSGLWTARKPRDLAVVGRLRTGIPLEQARAFLSVVSERVAQRYPVTNKNVSFTAYPEQFARPDPDAAEDWPITLSLLFGLGAVLLLIAALDVASILFMRAAARQGEMAVRSALGATRAQIIQLALIGNGVLPVAGGIVGLLLGKTICNVLRSLLIPVDLNLVQLDFQFDERVYAYAFIVTLITAIVAGLIPIRRAWRFELNSVLHELGTTQSPDRRQRRLGNTLVATQVAGSLVLLVIAGLFVRSLFKAEHMDLGFDAHQVMNFTIDTADVGYDAEKSVIFYRQLLERVRSVPGVNSATYSYSWPFGYYNRAGDIRLPGQELPASRRAPRLHFNIVDIDYFKTLSIPLLDGRNFSDVDDGKAPLVAIINRAMADRFWSGESAIGKTFVSDCCGAESGTHTVQVIGIVPDSVYINPTIRHEPYFYVPLAQNRSSLLTLQVRTGRPPSEFVHEIARQVADLDPNLPLFDVRPMEQALQGANGFYLFHVGAQLSGSLAVLALLLATIGLYGVVSYAVVRRTREFGIRMALGGDRRAILKTAIWHGFRPTMIGTGVGLILAFAVSLGISSLLPGVRTGDPVTFVTSTLVLAVVTLIACYAPARRASKIQPAAVLRYE